MVCHLCKVRGREEDCWLSRAVRYVIEAHMVRVQWKHKADNRAATCSAQPWRILMGERGTAYHCTWVDVLACHAAWAHAPVHAISAPSVHASCNKAVAILDGPMRGTEVHAVHTYGGPPGLTPRVTAGWLLCSPCQDRCMLCYRSGVIGGLPLRRIITSAPRSLPSRQPILDAHCIAISGACRCAHKSGDSACFDSSMPCSMHAHLQHVMPTYSSGDKQKMPQRPAKAGFKQQTHSCRQLGAAPCKGIIMQPASHALATRRNGGAHHHPATCTNTAKACSHAPNLVRACY